MLPLEFAHGAQLIGLDLLEIEAHHLRCGPLSRIVGFGAIANLELEIVLSNPAWNIGSGEVGYAHPQ